MQDVAACARRQHSDRLRGGRAGGGAGTAADGAALRALLARLGALAALLLGRDHAAGQTHAAEDAAHLGGVQLRADDAVHVVGGRVEGHLGKVGPQRRRGGAVLEHLDALHREGCGAVLGEHGEHNVERDRGLGAIQRGHLHQHVPGVHGDLAVVTVQDRRQRHHHTVGVAHHRIERTLPDERQIGPQMRQVLVDVLHQLCAVHLALHLQRHEADLLGLLGTIAKGRLHRAQIVCADRGQSPLPTDVLMQFVLQLHEALHRQLVQLEAAQNTTNNHRPHFGHGCVHVHAQHTTTARRRGHIVWHGNLTQKD
mmetsp:Transcript_11518/g.29026  ORF Transcript_11518/g.29026 Transcript_11518/m.29026 type:complete len:311 (+) Transcript_11518:693-1625(+)